MNCYFMEKKCILVLINVINYCFDFISYFITPLNYDKSCLSSLMKMIFLVLDVVEIININ